MGIIDWILDHLVIVIVIGSAIARWLMQQRAEKAPRTEKWPGDDGKKVDWGRGKSLKIPRSTRPPPLEAPPLPSTWTHPPPIPEVEVVNHAAEALRQQDLAERLRQIRAAKSAQPAKVPALKNPTKPVASTGPVTSLRGRLRNPRELRRAIIMNEILGPPAALK